MNHLFAYQEIIRWYVREWGRESANVTKCTNTSPRLWTFLPESHSFIFISNSGCLTVKTTTWSMIPRYLCLLFRLKAEITYSVLNRISSAALSMSKILSSSIVANTVLSPLNWALWLRSFAVLGKWHAIVDGRPKQECWNSSSSDGLVRWQKIVCHQIWRFFFFSFQTLSGSRFAGPISSNGRICCFSALWTIIFGLEANN